MKGFQKCLAWGRRPQLFAGTVITQRPPRSGAARRRRPAAPAWAGLGSAPAAGRPSPCDLVSSGRGGATGRLGRMGPSGASEGQFIGKTSATPEIGAQGSVCKESGRGCAIIYPRVSKCHLPLSLGPTNPYPAPAPLRPSAGSVCVLIVEASASFQGARPGHEGRFKQ